MTDWVTANKGSGPWPFVPQEEKCGYVNNPRWTGAPASEVIHHPCGYWPKPSGVPINVNIYGLMKSGANDIWGVNFDADGLRWVGAYRPETSLGGLTWYGTAILTMAGLGADAVLRTLDATTLIPLADYPVLLADDAPSRQSATFTIMPGTRQYFLLTGHGGDVRLLRFSTVLQREKRFIPATVTQGTDGHLYLLGGNSFTWNDLWKPVTGAYWSSMWTRIDDDVCDSPVTTWGDGTPRPSDSAGSVLLERENVLYVIMAQSVARGPIRRINPNTGEILSVGGDVNIFSAVIHGSRLYALRGVTTGVVTVYDATTLSVIAEGGVLPIGRAGSRNGITFAGNDLYVLGANYTGDAAIYQLDPESLTITRSTTFPAAWGLPQIIHGLNGQALVLGHNVGMGIINLNGLSIPSGTSPGLEHATPPALAFSAYADVGYASDIIISRDSTSTPQSQSRCGTSPVWPMPA